MKVKANYVVSSFTKRLFSQEIVSPSCGSILARVLESKFIFTKLKRCRNCHLLFRTPTTTENQNTTFYQNTCKQGFTTNLPTDSQLKQWLDKKFVDFVKV